MVKMFNNITTYKNFFACVGWGGGVGCCHGQQLTRESYKEFKVNNSANLLSTEPLYQPLLVDAITMLS